MRPVTHLLIAAVRAYRLLLAPWLGHGCRFQPSCSAYAVEALSQHGALRGTRLALGRLLRCHPWGGSGIDNVPGCGHASAHIRLKSGTSRQTR